MIVKRNEPFEIAYWDEVVAPMLNDEVEVFEAISHDQKVDLLGRARAMVFPIQWPEPFGLVMVEAMACGTPVVACPRARPSNSSTKASPASCAPGSTPWSTSSRSSTAAPRCVSRQSRDPVQQHHDDRELRTPARRSCPNLSSVHGAAPACTPELVVGQVVTIARWCDGEPA